MLALLFPQQEAKQTLLVRFGHLSGKIAVKPLKLLSLMLGVFRFAMILE